MIVLVGVLGVGKSILVNLLMWFYNVIGGCLCIDGYVIDSIMLKSLWE